MIKYKKVVDCVECDKCGRCVDEWPTKGWREYTFVDVTCFDESNLPRLVTAQLCDDCQTRVLNNIRQGVNIVRITQKVGPYADKD